MALAAERPASPRCALLMSILREHWEREDRPRSWELIAAGPDVAQPAA